MVIYHTKSKEPSQSDYLPISGEREREREREIERESGSVWFHYLYIHIKFGLV